MSENGATTFKSGSINSAGRPSGSRTKTFLEMQRIGEENCINNYMRLQKLADEGDKDILKFLHDKVVPNAKGSRVIIEMKIMSSLLDVNENENRIMQAMGSSTISIEEGEKLFSMTDQCRKTIESSEIAKIVEEMQQKMKEAGI